MVDRLPVGRNNFQERLPTSEVESASPVFEDLYRCDTEDLPTKWQGFYKEAYNKANTYRAQGNYEEALRWFRNSQSIIYYVHSQNVFTESMPVREAACSYMVIQCYIKLQREPDKVMRELHLMSEVFLQMLDLIDDGSSPNLRSAVECLKDEITNKNEIDISEIYSVLTTLWREEKDTLTEYQKCWIWKLSYFLTRYATDAFDFYAECTPHMQRADHYGLLLISIDQFSVEVKNSISDEYINSDPEGINQTYASIHRNWMPVHSGIVGAEASFIVGDHILGQTYYSSDYENSLWDVVNRFNEEGNEEVIVEDFEFALELLALVYFTDAYIDVDKYKESENKFNILYELADSEGLTRIMIMIKLYQARAASKHRDNDKVQDLLEKLDDLYEILKLDENNDQDELFEKWMKLIRSDQILNRHEVNLDIATLQRSFQESFSGAASITVENYDDRNVADISIWDIVEIERMFDSYTTSDAKIDRQRGSNLPLEAQIYYTLGRVAVKKAQIYGSRLETDPSDENGRDLLKAFYDARNYLCEAYSILRSMGYQEVDLIRDVANAYREMLDYNYTISGVAEDRKKDIIPDFSEHTDEMDEIAKHYQIQRWTQVVFDAIKSYTYRPGDDYLNLINNSFEDGVKRIIPEVAGMYIIDVSEDSFAHQARISNQKRKMIEETLEKSDPNRIAEVYFYHQKGGKLMCSFPLDKGGRRKMIIETDIPLTFYSKSILKDVGKSVDSLMRLFEARKSLEECGKEFPEAVGNLKRYVLQAATDLFDNLFEVHTATRSHSYGVAEMMKRSAEKMVEDDPNCTADPMEAWFAGLLHDVGKLGLDTKLILDKASRLLQFETAQVENHTILTARVLRGLLGLKHFKNIIAVASAHHVKYGVDKGYPVELPGDSIKTVLKKLMPYFPNLTPEEHDFLNSTEAELDEYWCGLGHDIVIDDQFQALTADDRIYRTPMAIKVLNGYAKSKSGRDFNPIRMKRFIGMVKDGVYTDQLIHSMKDLDSINNFDEPDIISWDDIYNFVNKFRNMIEYMLNINIGPFLEYMEKGLDKGLSLSSNCIGAGICEVYIQEEIEKDPSDKFKAKDKGKARYKKHREEFFNFLKEKFYGSWEGERVPNQ